jgi:hypothetical protein
MHPVVYLLDNSCADWPSITIVFFEIILSLNTSRSSVMETPVVCVQ